MKKAKKNGYDLLKEVEDNSRIKLIEARQQEMESILPNFYTVFMGVKIPSKQIKSFSGK